MTAYVADRPYSSAWTGATSAEKEDALKYASKLVDSLPFVGKKYETDISSQPLQWPRLIKTRHGWRIADLDADDNVVVPQAIKDAVCEEALAIIRAGDPDDSPRALAIADGVTSQRLADGTSESYNLSKSEARMGLLSPVAWRFLEPYITRGARSVR
jgi:hypothetical protein